MLFGKFLFVLFYLAMAAEAGPKKKKKFQPLDLNAPEPAGEPSTPQPQAPPARPGQGGGSWAQFAANAAPKADAANAAKAEAEKKAKEDAAAAAEARIHPNIPKNGMTLSDGSQVSRKHVQDTYDHAKSHMNNPIEHPGHPGDQNKAYPHTVSEEMGQDLGAPANAQTARAWTQDEIESASAQQKYTAEVHILQETTP
ncbi:unnamed protein product [Clonostachys byssicola]|uniref:Uncharacterized protein n=1 Tax=Clonostachys byssicola TaxID=160290 RepID=A0A9N9Y1Y5_9HYPO|nr:unnamed protein product [Clonostachys byssicola]